MNSSSKSLNSNQLELPNPNIDLFRFKKSSSMSSQISFPDSSSYYDVPPLSPAFLEIWNDHDNNSTFNLPPFSPLFNYDPPPLSPLFNHDAPPLSSLSNYDVFLSFRGEDTRASFTSHLSASLQNNGIILFKDDHSLQKGDSISKSLLRGIELSKISVIVFSTNYAGSRWCMQELVKIIECRRTMGHMVLPVFYGVDPSEVRHQTGDVGNVFRKLLNNYDENEYEAIEWKNALVEVGGIAGFVVLNHRYCRHLMY